MLPFLVFLTPNTRRHPSHALVVAARRVILPPARVSGRMTALGRLMFSENDRSYPSLAVGTEFASHLRDSTISATHDPAQLHSPQSVAHTFRHHGVGVPSPLETHPSPLLSWTISFSFIFLRTLLLFSKTHLQSFQQLPNSFCKTPGVAYPHSHLPAPSSGSLSCIFAARHHSHLAASP
jgi:hypothetical protein